MVLGWGLVVEDLHSIQKGWGSVSSRALFSSHVRVCICAHTYEYICWGLTVLPRFLEHEVLLCSLVSVAVSSTKPMPSWWKRKELLLLVSWWVWMSSMPISAWKEKTWTLRYGEFSCTNGVTLSYPLTPTKLEDIVSIRNRISFHFVVPIELIFNMTLKWETALHT